VYKCVWVAFKCVYVALPTGSREQPEAEVLLGCTVDPTSLHTT